MSTVLAAYLGPLALCLAAFLSFKSPGLRPFAALRVSEIAGLAAIVFALASGFLVWTGGAATGALFELGGFGLSARLDAVSVTMAILVSFVGWIVLRFSRVYMDGEARQGWFTGWICLTLAAVLLLVTAGNLVQLVLAWFATGAGLMRLLLTYPDRPGAQRVVRKKRVVALFSDLSLVVAAIGMAVVFGTGDIATILAEAGGNAGWLLWIVAGALALAAVMKSAQLPFHGWLTEVMEAPTPVSALLHAGVINAGGFLLIRFADVMLTAPIVLAFLLMLGGLTALVGGLVMLTQPAVKTSLAWSTVAQMGFMILQCGLALFPLALLHIVAHSLYKAHAFLASGEAVARVAASRRPGPIAIPNARAVMRAFLVALAIYAVVGSVFGLMSKSPQAIALGAILIFGVAYLLAQGFADAAPKALTRRTALWSVAASASYFALQSFSAWLTKGVLPATPSPGPLEWALIILALVTFGATAVAQATFPLWSGHPSVAGMRVHVANGFYINALIDRWLGNWRITEDRA
ncbi:oxidoreductase [Alphaproteobacteria bacterium GH1-50]|uniref:Probable inorganic carbon transporter subunit DabB n=1 Tax=Kangsaoukella pontilimi TaxID=2691042 RepID=A0A7C9II92_9RHOB|nr:proton-conducting transporter membrane subunit [Kangsaoukella pontilimi]MXQ09524.1 oxidoreductase [Kangsaoukella pontilimi]